MQIRLLAAALNHRDVFQRRGLYPGTAPSVPLLSDGCGVVTAPATSPLYGRRVLINPGRGWVAAERGPEAGVFASLGGTRHYPTGTLQEFVVVDEREAAAAPEHLTPEEGAALPLCGLTAWRAVATKAQVAPGDNVLVTGIGGGVAQMAARFAAARGARVFVSSSSPAKLSRAVSQLGAAGGVLYSSRTWENELADAIGGPGKLDAVIDGAGGDIVARTARLMRPGGRIVSYGMTLGPTLPFTMTAVLGNVDLLGSTMGSRREFADMLAFVRLHRIRPVVHRVMQGIDDVDLLEGLWVDMEQGKQFGKLVIRIAGDDDGGEDGRVANPKREDEEGRGRL